jgi:hypothetical protein
MLPASTDATDPSERYCSRIESIDTPVPGCSSRVWSASASLVSGAAVSETRSVVPVPGVAWIAWSAMSRNVDPLTEIRGAAVVSSTASPAAVKSRTVESTTSTVPALLTTLSPVVPPSSVVWVSLRELSAVPLYRRLAHRRSASAPSERVIETGRAAVPFVRNEPLTVTVMSSASSTSVPGSTVRVAPGATSMSWMIR